VSNSDRIVVVIPVDTITDEQWAQMDAADAIIFGSPTHMDTASAALHTFAEAVPPDTSSARSIQNV
jgi:multimeric flavodoxin WrbA